MPKKKSLSGVNNKEKRQYEHIRSSVFFNLLQIGCRLILLGLGNSKMPSRKLDLPHFPCYLMRPSKPVGAEAGSRLGHTWSVY